MNTIDCTVTKTAKTVNVTTTIKSRIKYNVQYDAKYLTNNHYRQLNSKISYDIPIIITSYNRLDK